MTPIQWGPSPPEPESYSATSTGTPAPLPPMTPEVKAAMERRRCWYAGELDYLGKADCVKDAMLLADAFLAEHPADGWEHWEPQWLSTLGMTLLWQSVPESHEWSINIANGAAVSFQVRSRRWWISTPDESVQLPNMPTKQSVRALLSALGHPAKGDSDE